MATVQRSILVEAPIKDSFAFWSNTGQFHTFMEAVEAVTTVDPSHLRWHAHTEDGPREWDTTLTLDDNHHTITWEHSEGREKRMAITFAPLEGNSCWMICTIEVDTTDIGGDLADLLGRTSRRLERDMRAGRDRIEEAHQQSKDAGKCAGPSHAQNNGAT